MHLCFRLFRRLLATSGVSERRDGGSIDSGAIHGEMRAVARAIPAALERIPVQMAANMCASRGLFDQRAVFIAKGRRLEQPSSFELPSLLRSPYETPCDVLYDPDLTVAEKREILAAWSSDRYAVPGTLPKLAYRGFAL